MAENHRKKKPLKALESMGKGFITSVVEDLVEKRVLKLEKEEEKKFYDAKPKDKPWVFVDSLQKRSREAGQILVQTFLNKDAESTSIEVLPEIELGPAESGEGTDTLKLCPHEKFLRICEERAGKIYPIKEKKDRTRLALIICNTKFDHLSERNGADLDITGMKELLEGLDFSVDVEENLTARKMEAVLQGFAARPEHRTSDSTFLVLMSHGLLEGICGTTHSDKHPDVLSYDTIFQIFNNRHCPSLRDKPKVIIIQACRGVRPGWVGYSPAASADCISPEDLEEDAIYRTHVEKDFIAFCSSTPHNASWRHKTKGSFFIRQLITCFQKYSWCFHLEEVFRKVQNSFENPGVKVQMPTIERQSMSRDFYLFPGN